MSSRQVRVARYQNQGSQEITVAVPVEMRLITRLASIRGSEAGCTGCGAISKVPDMVDPHHGRIVGPVRTPRGEGNNSKGGQHGYPPGTKGAVICPTLVAVPQKLDPAQFSRGL